MNEDLKEKIFSDILFKINISFWLDTFPNTNTNVNIILDLRKHTENLCDNNQNVTVKIKK